MVNIQGGIKLKTALAKDATVEIGTLPEGFRPYRSISNAQMLGGALFRVNISTAGSVTVTNFNSNSLSNSYSLPLNIVFTTGD